MLRKLNINDLEECFNLAFKKGYRYVAVVIKAKNLTSEEVIINDYRNMKDKIDYYKSAYNKDLKLKNNEDIKIIDFTYGDSFTHIEMELKRKRDKRIESR